MKGWLDSIQLPFPTDYTTSFGGLRAQEDIIFGPWFPQGVNTNLTANSALAQPTSKRADATIALA